MIVKLGQRRPTWLLYDTEGKRILGKHGSLAKAKAQERAIQISKARAAGYRIPRKAKP